MRVVRKEVCAIVPCYNEAEHIGAIVRAVLRNLDVCLVVDDCSSDRTSEEARLAGARLLRHERNLGKGQALQHGFALAAASGFRAAITLDGDGQHDPEEIPRFLEVFADEAFDIVLGNRMHDTAAMPWTRRQANRFSSWCLTRLTGVKIHDSQVGYRLIRLDALHSFALEGRRFDLESEILIKACRQGARLTHVPIRTLYQAQAHSRINPLLDTLRFFRLLWRFRKA